MFPVSWSPFLSLHFPRCHCSQPDSRLSKTNFVSQEVRGKGLNVLSKNEFTLGKTLPGHFTAWWCHRTARMLTYRSVWWERKQRESWIPKISSSVSIRIKVCIYGFNILMIISSLMCVCVCESSVKSPQPAQGRGADSISIRWYCFYIPR